MAATMTQPHLHRSEPPPSRHAPSSADLESHLLAAVREGAVRAAVATGLGAIAAIHAVDAVGKWTETRYVFWMYVAAIAGAIVVAAGVLFTRSRAALLAAAGVAGAVLLGYVVDRTVGLPAATGDIGNWTEPLGLASIVVESATIAVALGGFAGRRQARAAIA
ncbi:MAG: hypothetical protein QOJ35_3792 [Solirubrobacteraceae bacterium]|jgi:hypothetical protein|nr:hypothetical protein [Solirubrobacteraceae bacterium]